MGQLTPEFVMDVERRMQIISAAEYQRLLSALWWNQLAKERPSTGKSERLLWLLDTARIDYVNRLGGEVEFTDLISNTVEYVAKAATGGFKLNRFQLDDHDGGGVQLAAEWARQIGAYAAYWPQKQVAIAIRNGDQTGFTAYDGRKFFDTAHPVNPFDSSLGTYNNILTGAASGAYPGACPIDATNAATVDTAFQNLGKAIAYIQGALLMPNGEDPRYLKVRKLIVPAALVPRAQQLLNARVIAQAAGASGGGGADVEAVIRNWGLGDPIEAVEMGAAFTNGSDTSYYLATEMIGSDPLGALTYVNRDPFEVVYNDQMTSAELAKANELQWLTRGRNVVGYGHPYLLFKVKAT